MRNWKQFVLATGVTLVCVGCGNQNKSSKPAVDYSVCTENHDGKQCLYNQKKGCTHEIYQQLLTEINSLPANVYRCPADVIQKLHLAEQSESDTITNVVESSLSSQTKGDESSTATSPVSNESAKLWLDQMRKLTGFNECINLQSDAEVGFCVRFANQKCQPDMLSSLFDENNYDPTHFVPLPCGDDFSPGFNILYTQNEIDSIKILKDIEQKQENWRAQVSSLNNAFKEQKERFRLSDVNKGELEDSDSGLVKPYQNLTESMTSSMSSPRAMARLLKKREQVVLRERSLLKDQTKLLVQASDFFSQKQEFEQKELSGGSSSEELEKLKNKLKETGLRLVSLSNKINSDKQSLETIQQRPTENGYATLKNAKNCLDKSQDGQDCLSPINQVCSDDQRKALIEELTSRQLAVPPLCYPPQSFVKKHPGVEYCWNTTDQCLQYENTECQPKAVTSLRDWMNENNQNLSFCHALKSVEAGRQKGAWPESELPFVDDLTDLFQDMTELEASNSLEQRDGIINQCLIKVDAILKEIALVSKTDANKRDMAYFKHTASQLKNFLQSCKDKSDVKCH